MNAVVKTYNRSGRTLKNNYETKFFTSLKGKCRNNTNHCVT